MSAQRDDDDNSGVDVSDIKEEGGFGWALNSEKRTRASEYINSGATQEEQVERAFELVGLLGSSMNAVRPFMNAPEENEPVPGEGEQQRRREQAKQQVVNIGLNERDRRSKAGSFLLAASAVASLPLATKPLLLRASLLPFILFGYGFRRSGQEGL